MTPEELQELRDWAARKMGWIDVGLHYTIEIDDKTFISCTKEDTAYGTGWRPDDKATGQIWMLVERMRELGWRLIYKNNSAMFETMPIVRRYRLTDYYFNPNPCLAILLAARATEG